MDRHEIKGGCYCGQVAVTVALSKPLAAWQPRACDCDYCRPQGVCYLSDPAGAMHIRCLASGALKRFRQGSEQAEFVFCGACGHVVGVVLDDGARRYGAVNARVLAGELPSPVVASPRTLGPEAKVARWKQIWFADVVIGEACA